VKKDYTLRVETQLLTVDSSMPEDEEIAIKVKHYNEKLEDSFKKTICYFHSPVDAKFSTIRSQNSCIGSFISDIMRIYMNTDCSLINAGCLRIDSMINKGIIK
jgi:5'-nucleotidase